MEMRKKLTQLVNNEIANAKKGLPAYIHCKINHVTDYKFIDKLYDAAAAGVEIKMVIRGMCSMVSSQPKLKGNLQVVGIVDKFLEHSRILIFCNNGLEKYYICSADWMTRNLDQRIEVSVPVYDKEIQQELKTIVEYALKDNVKARIVDGKGDNILNENDEAPFRSQQELIMHYRNLEENRKPVE